MADLDSSLLQDLKLTDDMNLETKERIIYENMPVPRLKATDSFGNVKLEFSKEIELLDYAKIL